MSNQSNQSNQSNHETMDNNTFYGQREPFVALPISIRDHLDLPSVGVLWLLQSYQPERRFSLERLVKDSGFTREEIILILQKLVARGYVKSTPGDPQSGARARFELRTWEDASNNQERSA
jgi:hypothetical protein